MGTFADPRNKFDRLTLGRCTIDLRTGEVRGGDSESRLEPKVLAVLVAVARRGGDVVSKAELLEEVWDGFAVSDDAVWRTIAEIRRSLGDDSRDPRVVETLPRRGYRLVCEAQWAESGERTSSPVGAQQGALRSLRWGAVAVAVGVGALALLVATTLRSAAESTPAASVNLAHDTLPPGDPGSWDADTLYAVGLRHYERREANDVERAIEFFEGAIEKDPWHALALAGLSNAYSLKGEMHYGGTEWLLRALAKAELAVAIDPRLAEAHKALGFAHATLGQSDAAIVEYRRAIELRPGYASALNNLGTLLIGRGRFVEAIEVLLEVESRESDRAIHLHNIGTALDYLGATQLAREYFEAALAIDPLQAQGVRALVRMDLKSGHLDLAQRRVTEMLERSSTVPIINAAADVALAKDDLQRAGYLLERSLGAAAPETNVDARIRLAYVMWRAGMTEQLSVLVRGYESRLDEAAASGERWRLAPLLAALRIMRGRDDDALDLLERANTNGYLDFGWIAVDPLFASLREHERFRRLIRSRREWAEAAVLGLEGRVGAPGLESGLSAR